MQKPVKVCHGNIGLILARFRQLLKKSAGRKFHVKRILGKPKKREDWKGFYSVNHTLLTTPVVEIHPFAFDTTRDTPPLVTMKLSKGELERIFSEDIPDPEKYCMFNIYAGDKIIFKQEGIIVMSNDMYYSGSEARLSTLFTT